MSDGLLFADKQDQKMNDNGSSTNMDNHRPDPQEFIYKKIQGSTIISI